MNLSEQAKKLLKKFYLYEDETIDELFESACSYYSRGDKNLEERLNYYIKNKYLIFLSPMLSNSRREVNKSKRSLPVSCYIKFVDDTLESLINHTVEARYLAVSGGGIGCDWSKVRSVSRKSPGTIPFLHTINADMTAYRQEHTRKGSYAAYINVDHPEIIEFIDMRLQWERCK